MCLTKKLAYFLLNRNCTQPVIITKYTSSGWYKTCNVYSENSMEKESSIRWWFGPGELKSLSYRCFVWRLSCLFKLRWVFCAGFRVDTRDNCRSPNSLTCVQLFQELFEALCSRQFVIGLFMSTTSLNWCGYEDRGLTQEHSGCFLRKVKESSASLIKLGWEVIDITKNML